MDVEERSKAESQLVDFVTEYCGLIGAHLEAVRVTMGETTQAVMDGVMNISDVKEDKRKMADGVLQKRAEAEEVKNNFQGDDSSFENALMDKEEALKNNGSESAAKLAGHITNFDKLDDDMQEILFAIMGALSTDDVVGQRIEHICQAMDGMRDGLSAVLSSGSKLISEKSVIEFEANLLKSMVQGFTMPSEHEAFSRVFTDVDVVKLKAS